MKHLIALTAVVALVLAAGLPAAAFAGDKGKGKDKDKTDTISGCLGEGEAAGQFVLTKDETGDQVRVTGSGDLGDHVGHEVALTGHWEGEQSEGRGQSKGKHFVVKEIQHISATCEAS